jgi:hypothetical protein
MGVLDPLHCQLTGRWQLPSILAGAICDEVPTLHPPGSEPLWPAFSQEFGSGTYTAADLLAISGGASIRSLDIDVRSGDALLTMGSSTSELLPGGSFTTEAEPGFQVGGWTLALDGDAKISWCETL